ncbi:glutamate synthase subunit beta [Ferrimicrobium sp.]|uniref:glutamate synthase subunit beta n=1 Tax=Ferrimicrobium sp. TaxID=2926050 RepID=UPI002615D85D|nr:glutamate synthase subunit beta [Ferrimicrobium sp.]
MAADPRGFLKFTRRNPVRRPVALRLRDWNEVYAEDDVAEQIVQAQRCMDCGIPFCHRGCPLGNLIPEWNELVGKDRWASAAERLHATNNFPEFTGRLCPAPCETACVLALNRDAVTIEYIEKSISEMAFAHGWVEPIRVAHPTGYKVAIVGSGPAGLAAAQQLVRAGHAVTVFERADRIGGLLRYGIPEFKMEKAILDRRLAQLTAEGIVFFPNTTVGRDLSFAQLRADFDAVVLALGATRPRLIAVPGSEGAGILPAMEYLPHANRAVHDRSYEPPIVATDKRVVILGGGDTGADCLGTALRQGAKEVIQLEIMPRPSDSRPETAPWPMYPPLFRISSAHEEGGDRVFARETVQFELNASGQVTALITAEVAMSEDGKLQRVPSTERRIEADLVLLAMGFLGPDLSMFDLAQRPALSERGTIQVDDCFVTSLEGVFAAGDARRGQSLIVWAIAEGRSVAYHVDAYLMGNSDLGCPIAPDTAALTIM